MNPDPAKLKATHDKDANLVASVGAATLIVIDDRDIVRPEHALELTRLIPGARLLILPGGHADYLGEAVVTEGIPVTRS